jgi:hypothetical protein
MAVLKNKRPSFGQGRTLIGKKDIINKSKKGNWFCNGQGGRFFTIFFKNLKERPVDFLKN